MHVEMGYFENFADRGDTILVDGDVSGLLALAQILRGLEAPDAEPVAIHKLPFVVVHHGVELTAHPVGRELGVRRTDSVFTRFCWNHSEEGWLEAAEKIEGVVEGNGGHNWLECIGWEDVVVMVSTNEYDSAWWLKWG